MNGILLKIIAGFCYVEAGNKIYECKPRGNMRKNGMGIFAGDNVEFSELSEDKGVIEKVLPRKNSLIRPPLANIDRLFIISSHNTPAPNATLIDRLAAIAESKDIEPIIVFNKADLGDFTEWKNIYEKSGFKTFVVSANDNASLNDLKEYLFNSNGISAFTGNSGVGKSSILNAIFPQLKLQTGAVSEKLGRGKHTTRHVELYKIANNSYIADTPGFSSLDIQKFEILLKDELPNFFSDFREFVNECKFTSCSHTKEKGCAVIEAVNNGEIQPSRYNSYITIYNEIKDIKEWELKKK